MSNLKVLTAALSALALSLFSGCTPATQQNQNTSQAPSSTAQPVQATENPSPSVSPTPSGQNNLSVVDKKFMTEAAQGGLAEVQLGQLASQRATSDAVKQFGQRMVQDHTQANTQLKQLASQKGVTLPTTIGSENQKVKQQLSKLSKTRFDKAYINDMVKDHVKDVSLFQSEAQGGQDTDVKAFAAQTLPTLQKHLQMAKSIANPTTPSTTTPSSTPTPTSTP
ncbi:MAG: DUF4142 domain-containing protein [Nostocaceae cyanobacterium]|nr:DUF4142 domain-containing protein [Nostocaceae cyanobacterium]